MSANRINQAVTNTRTSLSALPTPFGQMDSFWPAVVTGYMSHETERY